MPVNNNGFENVSYIIALALMYFGVVLFAVIGYNMLSRSVGGWTAVAIVGLVIAALGLFGYKLMKGTVGK